MGEEIACRRSAGRISRRILGAFVVLVLGQTGAAHAFPLVDPTNATTVAAATDLAAPDAQDLTHQLQIANGLGGLAAGGGWTFQPRLGLQEALTDNVLQVNSPRRWDLTTYFSPGLTIVGNTERAQVSLDYAPVLIMNARTGSQNALNQQLNGTATITVVNELAFVDLRAVSGVQSMAGALGGGGTIGAGNIGGLTAGAGTGGAGLTGANRQNEEQTSSLGISPYLLQKFGDYGTLKVGYSLNLSQSNPITGFRYLPLPTGSGAQSLMSQEETINFKSGDFLDDFQDTFDLDFTQSTSTFQTTGTTTVATTTPTSTQSSRDIITDQLSYALTHWATLNGSLGHEYIVYSGAGQAPIDDLTWKLGATLTPNPDSSITFSYGHELGAASIAFDAHYQLTARTTITADYNQTLGTQLENLQQQLNAGSIGNNGGTVNANTGGQQFTGTNNLPTQGGVFRFNTFTATVRTQLDRDTLTLTVNNSTSSSTGGTASTSTQSSGVSLQWIRQLSPDLTLNTSGSYNVQTGGVQSGGNSMAFNIGLQYAINDSLSSSARYTFFKSTSQSVLFNLYENMLILGITKRF